MKTKSIRFTSVFLSLLIALSVFAAVPAFAGEYKFPPLPAGTRYGFEVESYPAIYNINSTVKLADKEDVLNSLKADFPNMKIYDVDYYGTLSDGSRLVFPYRGDIAYFAESSYNVVGKYFYKVPSLGKEVQLYRDHELIYITEGYTDGKISDKLLDEIAEKLCYNEFINTKTYQKNIDEGKLATPLAKTVSKEDGLMVDWYSVYGAEKYRVYIKKDGGWQRLGDTASTSFVCKDALIGNSYTFTVRCISADGKKFTSGYMPEGTTGTYNLYLNAPVITKLENTSQGVKLSWNKRSCVSSYRVFVKEGNTWKGIGNSTSSSFVHKGAKSGTTYTYTLRCLTADGKTFCSHYNKTGWSKKYVAQPKITTLTNDGNGVKITWNKVAGAESYRVFIKNGSSWKGVGNTSSNTFTHKGLKSGVNYTYTVRCQTADAKSFTSSYDASGKTIKFIAEPAITSLSNTGSGIKISWSKSAGASKYRVFLKNGNSWKKLADTASTSYTHSGVKNNTSYTYTVRCLSSDGKSFTSSYNKNGKSIKAVVKQNTDKTTTSNGYVTTKINGMTIKYQSTVYHGQNTTLTVYGAANTSSTITVRYNSGVSKASGLGSKYSDGNGKVEWTWKIGNQTAPGTYPITITQGNKSAKVNFTVR